MSTRAPRCVLVLALAVAGVAGLPAQSTWQIVPPGAAPAARHNHAGAYDLARSVLVIHGGDNAASTLFGDTWEWQGGVWTPRPSLPSPGPRWSAQMAFDVMTGSVILFGGAATINGTPLAETWRWNGNTWTLLQPPSSPPALVAHAMTTHLGSGQIVLFGGRNVSGQEQAQTWTFDGFTWTQLTGPQPPARCCHDLVYDVARAVVVLYGGWSGINYGDTWELGPFGWTQRFPPASPTARWGHRFAAAPSLNGVVMHGGTLGSLPGNETWLWDGTTWQQIAVGTSPTQVNHVMHRHWAFGRVVLFGGVTTNWAASNETWTLGTTSPASFAPFGAGCAGPGGAPALFPSAAPWIGTTATASMSPVPALGVFVVGFSNTVSGGLPLPASLAPIGMPGCSLYVSLDVLLAAVPTGVVATLSIPLPFQPALVGQQFFVQGASFDPGANPMGLTVSNALAATIGWL